MLAKDPPYGWKSFRQVEGLIPAVGEQEERADDVNIRSCANSAVHQINAVVCEVGVGIEEQNVAAVTIADSNIVSICKTAVFFSEYDPDKGKVFLRDSRPGSCESLSTMMNSYSA